MQSKSCYENFRKHSLQVLPSVDYLKKWNKEVKRKEGVDPKIYGGVADDLSGECGQLLFDEMKLVGDVAWNVKDNTVVGFAGTSKENLSLQAIMDEVLFLVEDEEDEGTKELAEENTEEKQPELHERAVYVNQFRLRTTRGQIKNLEFFYNNGTLSGDELLEQVMHVISCCELAGIMIHALVCDAGGPNKSLFTLLTKKKETSHGWLEPEQVSFPNPCDLSRRIWFIFCTVHGLKAMRNNLLRSLQTDEATQNFWNGCNFGWAEIIDQHLRNYEKTEIILTSYTRVNKRVARPDKFSQMSVTDALIIFEFKTLVHECHHIAQMLGIEREVAYDEILEVGKNESARLFVLLEILKSNFNTLSCESTSRKVAPKLANLEF
jgi:hypothetical protein